MQKAVSANILLSPRRRFWRKVFKNWQLYVLISPAFLFVLVFSYFPMYGIQLAFKDFSIRAGIWASPWSDPFFRHFLAFVQSFNFSDIIRNTLVLNLYGLIAGFPIPIVLAILLNEVKNKKYMKTVQNITYVPYFISTVVLVGMLNMFFQRLGIVNAILGIIGAESVPFLMRGDLFRHLFVWSGIWQTMGYSSIIYFAALSGVSPELHEAAIIDGASRLRRIWHISLPHIRPTIVILFILGCSSMMNVGFEKVFLMQNAVNLRYSEVMSTYIYKLAMERQDFSLGAAVGLFNNTINILIMLTVNWIARRVSKISLF